ncbi:MAG: lactate dehydrogenase [Lachnospiraceae bacterium]|nr:lactate dehydrogenase [Lachnospiraceae bacterium]
MKIFAYSLRPYDEQEYFEDICRRLDIEYGFTSEYPSLENAYLAEGFDALSILTNTMDPALLDRFKACGIRYISTRTIGYDHIDNAYAHSIGIRTASISYDPTGVADYAIMMMLMGLRRIMPIMERGNIQDYSLKGKLGRHIQDCTVGIIGTGRIGTKVIEHLTGFGCKMLCYDIKQNETAACYAEYTDLETIYRTCDIISLHVPGLEENYHMIGADQISEMKDGVMIINCARGMLIDTQAMIAAIESGRIGFAGLDTIENEAGLYYLDRKGDILDNHDMAILRSFPNVLLTSHMAFYTDVAVREMVEHCVEGILQMDRGETNPFEIR